MNTILVPTNLTASSKNAAEYAARLCQLLNCPLTLFTVTTIPTAFSEVPYIPENTNAINMEYEKLLEREAERLFEMFDIEVKHLVETGIPDLDIVDYADQKGADLIVMGMEHKEGIDRILGSTASSVIGKSKRPVLIIPSGIAYGDFGTIVYATDLSYDLSPLTLRPLKVLADVLNAKLQLVHVRKPGDIVSQEDISGKVKLDMAVAGIECEYVALQNEDIEDGIRGFLTAHPARMLAMTAHKHGFLERLFGKRHTKNMLYSTDIPLLILHDRP